MKEERAILHLKQDEQLKILVESIELSISSTRRGLYFDLLKSIVSQQLSTKAALTIFNRFLALFPQQEPSAELLVKMDFQLLRQAGLSNQKASYLQNTAEFAIQNPFERQPWEDWTDSEVITFLTQIKGVGVWTVQMLLMFSLGRPDVFPIQDLGIQQAMIQLYRLEERGASLFNKMEQHAEAWRPYRTLACMYLWRWKDAGIITVNEQKSII